MLVHELVDFFTVGTVLALWMVEDLTCRLGDAGVSVEGLGLSPHLVIDYSWVCQYISPPSISKVSCFLLISSFILLISVPITLARVRTVVGEQHLDFRNHIVSSNICIWIFAANILFKFVEKVMQPTFIRECFICKVTDISASQI